MKTLPLLVGSWYCYVYNVGGKQEKLVHNIWSDASFPNVHDYLIDRFLDFDFC
jgi:hypothetical protein